MACIVGVEGACSGQQFALDQHRIVMFGREDDCTFQILDDRVSRHHLQVKRDPKTGGHIAVDFSSANGVLVNGRRIEQELPLSEGDLIQIGDSSLIYMEEDLPDAKRVSELAKMRGQRRRGTMRIDASDLSSE